MLINLYETYIMANIKDLISTIRYFVIPTELTNLYKKSQCKVVEDMPSRSKLFYIKNVI